MAHYSRVASSIVPILIIRLAVGVIASTTNEDDPKPVKSNDATVYTSHGPLVQCIFL